MLIILTLVLLATSAFTQESKPLVKIDLQGKPVSKRYVVRTPPKWNGGLVIGAHGGSGGNAVDRSGKVYATTETALDDVIGDYAIASGFAYASVDRDGIGGTREGVSVMTQFADSQELKSAFALCAPA
jgi:hypothetical protein